MAQEKNFENRVKAFLQAHGCWYVKYWAGAAYTRSGVPDILTCVGGYFVGIELKADHGRPSDLQLVTLSKIVESNGIAMLLYPKDYDAFKDFCTRLIRGAGVEELYENSKYAGFLTAWWNESYRIRKGLINGRKEE